MSNNWTKISRIKPKKPTRRTFSSSLIKKIFNETIQTDSLFSYRCIKELNNPEFKENDICFSRINFGEFVVSGNCAFILNTNANTTNKASSSNCGKRMQEKLPNKTTNQTDNVKSESFDDIRNKFIKKDTSWDA